MQVDRDQEAQPDKLVQLDLKDPMDHLVIQVTGEILDLMVTLGVRVILGLLALMADLVLLVQMGQTVHKVVEVKQDLLDQQVQLVQLETQVPKVHKDLLGHLGEMENVENQVHRDLLVILETEGIPDLEETMGIPVLRDHKVLQAVLEEMV